MTETRSPDVVPTQLSRMRDALRQYGLAYGLALALVAVRRHYNQSHRSGICRALSFPDSRGAGRRNCRRVGTRAFGYVSQPGNPSLFTGEYSSLANHLVTDIRDRHCPSPHIYGARDRHFLVWRASGHQLAAGDAKRAKRRGAGGARAIHPRHRAGRHDRDRRARESCSHSARRQSGCSATGPKR